MEKILIQAIKGSHHVWETYSNIINSCSRLQTTGRKEKMLLPCMYIYIKTPFNGKIKVSVRKLLKSFDQGSGLIMRAAELIGNKNWKSA